MYQYCMDVSLECNSYCITTGVPGYPASEVLVLRGYPGIVTLNHYYSLRYGGKGGIQSPGQVGYPPYRSTYPTIYSPSPWYTGTVVARALSLWTGTRGLSWGTSTGIVSPAI